MESKKIVQPKAEDSDDDIIFVDSTPSTSASHKRQHPEPDIVFLDNIPYKNATKRKLPEPDVVFVEASERKNDKVDTNGPPEKRKDVALDMRVGASPALAVSTIVAKNKNTNANKPQDRSVEVFTRRLMKEFKEIQKLQDSNPNPVFTAELLNDQLSQWHVRLYQVDPDSLLAGDMRRNGIAYILLHLDFPKDFPFAPPFMRVVEPQISGGYVMGGGALCMELLTPSGWASTYTVEAVVMQFAATVVKGGGRVREVVQLGGGRGRGRARRGRGGAGQEYTRARAEQAFRHIVKLHEKIGWSTLPKKDG